MKAVGSLDRFLPIYSNLLNKDNSWTEHNISKEMIYNKNGPEIKAGSLSLWKRVDHFLKAHFLK